MSKTDDTYVSCIRLGGHPILPPLMAAHDRAQLQKYKEEAIKIEQELSARSQVSELENIISEAETETSSCDSSTVHTEQVIEFIREALSGASHIHEVKLLQSALFDELQKYEQSGRDTETCDTLHNVEDISMTEGNITPFSDLSPIKPVTPNFKELVNVVPLSDPQFKLTIPNEQLDISQLSNSTNSHTSAHDSPSNSAGPNVRRNSYTLDSPSHCVLAYLRSVTGEKNTKKDNELNNSLSLANLSDNRVIRNLNKEWDNLDMTKTSSRNSLGSTSRVSFSLAAPEFEDDTCNNSCNNNAVEVNLNEKPMPFQNQCSLEDNNNRIERAAIVIQAGIRGYLTRRLMKTFKVVELKNAIRDNLITALQFYTEPATNKAEVELHQRLAVKLEGLCREWHSIFFELTPLEKIKIIQVDRNRALLGKRPVIRKKSKERSKTLSESTDMISSRKSTDSQAKSKAMKIRRPETRS